MGGGIRGKTRPAARRISPAWTASHSSTHMSLTNTRRESGWIIASRDPRTMQSNLLEGEGKIPSESQIGNAELPVELYATRCRAMCRFPNACVTLSRVTAFLQIINHTGSRHFQLLCAKRIRSGGSHGL
jgi:hypothetical protein